MSGPFTSETYQTGDGNVDVPITVGRLGQPVRFGGGTEWYSKGSSASLTDRPDAVAFGSGEWSIGSDVYISDGTSWKRGNTSQSFATIADRPAASVFGVGQCQIGNVTYSSDGITWEQIQTAPLRQVATRCVMPNTLNASFKQTMNVTRHWVRDKIDGIQLVFGNWKGNPTGADVGSGGTMTIEASLTYNAVITRATFDGINAPVVANAGEAISDVIPVSLSPGDYFDVRSHATFSNGILFLQAPAASTAHGEAFAYGVTTPNLVMGGAVANSGAGVFTPIAIIGYSKGRAVALIGDSRTTGIHDTYTNSKFNDTGIFARAIGPLHPYTNFGLAGDTINSVQTGTNAALRFSLINRYFTDVVFGYGINDIKAGKTAADVWTDLQNAYALTKLPIHQATIEPETTSTDAWATTVNQTAAASNTQRVLANNIIRQNVVTASVLDIADVVESARDSGIWKAAYTDDGLHEVQLANAFISKSINSNLR